MRTLTPRCVVFDIDDTVYLERTYVNTGFRAVGELVERDFGSTDFAALAWSLFEQGVRGDTFNQVLAKLGIAADTHLVQRLVSHYRSHKPQIHLAVDAQNCLQTLSPLASLAAITDGPAVCQHAKIQALNLGQWFSPIIVTAELGPGKSKPHPEAFQLVETALQLPGHLCAYVADNPNKDFVAPRRLGWHTVRVRRHESLHEGTPSGPDVDAEISTLDDLPGTLGFG